MIRYMGNDCFDAYTALFSIPVGLPHKKTSFNLCHTVSDLGQRFIAIRLAVPSTKGSLRYKQIFPENKKIACEEKTLIIDEKLYETSSLTEEVSQENSKQLSTLPKRRSRVRSYNSDASPDMINIRLNMTLDPQDIPSYLASLLLDVNGEKIKESDKKFHRHTRRNSLEIHTIEQYPNTQNNDLPETSWQEAEDKAYKQIAVKKEDLTHWLQYHTRQEAIENYNSYQANNPLPQKEKCFIVRFSEDSLIQNLI